MQNVSGEWIDAPPIPGTFVVNIGKGETSPRLASAEQSWSRSSHIAVCDDLALETVTQGVAIATSHRVLSPEKGSTPRYSIPFFQMISRGTVIGNEVIERESFRSV